MKDHPAPFSVDSIRTLARRRAAAPAWIGDEGLKSWTDFGEQVRAAARACADAGVTAGAVVVTPGEASLESLAWLFGAALVGAVAAPLRGDRRGELERWSERFAIGWMVDQGGLRHAAAGHAPPAARELFAELARRGNPGLILATGGTTGAPKVVLHDLAVLLSVIPVRDARPLRVLPLMRFDHIGGLDMAWQALAAGHVLIAPPAEIDADSVAAAVERHRVEVLPATASFLNLLLLAEAHLRHDLSSLRVIPFGAEPMPRGLLERLRAVFPSVEFAQRFGTSETGALPVRGAGDGLELRGDALGFAWRIVDGELHVRSPARALGYLAGPDERFEAGGWFRTGDLAEPLAGGGFRILGRRDELINVGGEKVLPAEVESALLENPLVADCSVGALRNAVLGHVVAADIVWRGPERDALDVKRRVHEFAAGRVARHKLPAVVRLVDRIACSGHRKKHRPVFP